MKNNIEKIEEISIKKNEGSLLSKALNRENSLINKYKNIPPKRILANIHDRYKTDFVIDISSLNK